jgi:regulatory protein
MAGRITALRYQKRNRDRVSVYLDGAFAFGLPAIVAAGLKAGQHLTDAEIADLHSEGSIESAYGKALNYLSYRPRSRAEMVTYLEKRGQSEDQVEAIILRLERAGLLNDTEFARFWVENRERFRPRGMHALRYELRSKGIDDETIEGALKSIDVSESAYRAAHRKAQQLGHLEQREFDRKLVEYLGRRGFSYEVARQVAERCWVELAAGSEGLT